MWVNLALNTCTKEYVHVCMLFLTDVVVSAPSLVQYDSADAMERFDACAIAETVVAESDA